MPNKPQIKNNFTEDNIYAFTHILIYSFQKKIFVEGQMLCLEYDTNISFCPQGVCSLE